MKLLHLSDLHLGKRLHEYSMTEDQEYILHRIIGIVDDEKPDGVMIAGDIYDKSVPTTEAVTLFDKFLSELCRRNVRVFCISGNHDSPERIAFGSRIMDNNGIYMSPVYDGKVEPIPLKDDYGEVNIYMLPFIKPIHVRHIFDDDKIVTYNDAVSRAVKEMDIDTDKRNILITHQFVTGAVRTESEELSVGGTDNVDVSVFDKFDYVALGHLHAPQNCGKSAVRYCGTPLKYSFSEAQNKKSVTIVEISEKGNTSYRTTELVPLRDMKEIKGKYSEITRMDYYFGTTFQEDYLHITLTDEQDIPEAAGRLRAIYHNLMKLDYDNHRTRTDNTVPAVNNIEQKTPIELFAEFYKLINNDEMSEEQRKYAQKLIEEVWEED